MKPEERNQTELLIQHRLAKILVQKQPNSNQIRSILIIDNMKHVTSINSLDVESMFDPCNWKVFDINENEHLLDMSRTGDFSQIEFVVGKLPELK